VAKEELVRYYELLKKLEEAFPDKLPSLRDYDPSKLLVSIGNQEVIRFVRRLSDEKE
jgi:hypothetical protein